MQAAYRFGRKDKISIGKNLFFDFIAAKIANFIAPNKITCALPAKAPVRFLKIKNDLKC
ncbi:MAG: hypothetical protein ACI9LN_004147 [Saprospiraceae bacterium]